MAKDPRINAPTIVATCVAAVGAAVAISLVIRKAVIRRPSYVFNRCLRAADELDRKIHCASARA